MTKAGGEVKALALMMNHVGGPKNSTDVAGPMEPVIKEIVYHKTQHPAPSGLPEGGGAQRVGLREDPAVGFNLKKRATKRDSLTD